jgi:hypothetical protein
MAFLTIPAGNQSNLAGNQLKGLSGSAHKKSAIVKADRDPAKSSRRSYFRFAFSPSQRENS